MRLKLGIGPDDRVVLPQREAEALGAADGDPVVLQTARGVFTLLTRGAGREQPYFAGSLAAASVAEAFHFVFTALKTGVLLLAFGGAARRAGAPADQLRRKTVYFREGQVVFASSSDRADRLGAVLWREGMVGRGDLERCGRLVRAGRPLGQILVDEGLLSAGQLYAGMMLQVREIVLAAFPEDAGEFVFLEGPFDERNAVKLPERTRDLLLGGVKRAEEVEGLAGGMPPLDAAPRPLGRGDAAGLGERPALLLEALDGSRTLRRAMDETQLGVRAGLEALGELVRRGLVAGAPRAAAPAAEEEVLTVTAGTREPAPTPLEAAAAAAKPRASGPFETYRRIFQHVFRELSRAQPEAQRRLNSYFERVPEKQRPIFEGVRVDGEGEVDVAQVLLNVSSTGAYKGAAARARALEALEDVLAFALFEVKNCMVRAEADALLRQVGRMQVGKA